MIYPVENERIPLSFRALPLLQYTFTWPAIMSGTSVPYALFFVCVPFGGGFSGDFSLGANWMFMCPLPCVFRKNCRNEAYCSVFRSLSRYSVSAYRGFLFPR